MQNRFIQCIDSIVTWWSIFLMGSMTALVILAVFFRYVLSLTWVWSEELITILFISSTFFGSVLLTKNNEHISVDFLFNALKGNALKALRIFISLLVIAVQLIILKYSIGWIITAGNIPTPGFNIPFYFIYSFMPISALLICMYEIAKIITYISPERKAV